MWNKLSPTRSRNVAADLKPEEIQPWAQDLVKERIENLDRDFMNVLCLPLGPLYPTDADSTGAEQTKIVQTPDLIIIRNPDLTIAKSIWMAARWKPRRIPPGWLHAGGG